MNAFQFIFNNATSISVNRRGRVSQTQSRNGRVNALARGGQVWEFVVAPPPIMSWTASRAMIEAIDKADLVNVLPVQINKPEHNWIVRYQGGFAPSMVVNCTIPLSGNQIQLDASPSLPAGQFKFKAGDFVELSFNNAIGRVYTVVEDVVHNQTTVTLNRPLQDVPASQSAVVRRGPDCRWLLLCTQMPNWTLVSEDRVAWDGEFVFVEV